MHLLQVCNVGNVCGGTAACAWTITRAFLDWRHTVAFLSPPTSETRTAFAACRIEVWRTVAADRVAALDPDLLLLHNTTASRAESIAVPLTVQYLHSRIAPAPADVTVACSQWLENQFSPGTCDGVLYQPVPAPSRAESGVTRPLGDRVIVGRLCTPTPRKWPGELVPFYARLARQHPLVDWEFVGAPAELVHPLITACEGRARFHPAGWPAREHLARWDALLYHHPGLTETFGRTAAEAMLAGCIPIVDARGGFQEQVRPGTGFLCSTADNFSRAIEQIIPLASRRRLSRAAQAQATERFSTDAFARRFQKLLSAALGSARQPD